MGDDDFEGNTTLVRSEDSVHNQSLSMTGGNEKDLISRFEIIKFRTEDISIVFKCFMANNMIQVEVAVGEENTYFLSNHHKFIGNNKIEESTS